MNYKAIVFDLDGTIIDTSNIWSQATRDLLKRKGVVLTPELESRITERIHGLAMDKTCQVLKELTAMEDPVEQIILEKSQIACSLYNKGISFVPGFVEFFRDLRARELLTAIATNADPGSLAIAMDSLHLPTFFAEHIYSIACVNNVCKPNPDVYLYAARRLGVDPKECIAIEDSAHGITAAQAAGMFCIGINTSRNYEQVKHADLIVDRYDQIDLGALLSA